MTYTRSFSSTYRNTERELNVQVCLNTGGIRGLVIQAFFNRNKIKGRADSGGDLVLVESLEICEVGILLQITSDTDMVAVSGRRGVPDRVVQLFEARNRNSRVAAAIDLNARGRGDSRQ